MSISRTTSSTERQEIGTSAKINLKLSYSYIVSGGPDVYLLPRASNINADNKASEATGDIIEQVKKTYKKVHW